MAGYTSGRRSTISIFPLLNPAHPMIEMCISLNRQKSLQIKKEEE